MLVNINLSVVRPLSVPHAHMSKTKQNRQTRSYYGTLCRSWHRWLDCLVQILPRRGSGKDIRSGKDILVLNFKKICLNINTAFCSTWPQTTHSCCQPSSTDVTQQGVVIWCERTTYDGWNLSSVVLMTTKSNASHRRASFFSLCEILVCLIMFVSLWVCAFSSFSIIFTHSS